MLWKYRRAFSQLAWLHKALAPIIRSSEAAFCYSKLVAAGQTPLGLNHIRSITKLTTFNVVDNSKLGQKTRSSKKPYLIGFYRKRKTADIGDVIKVAVQGKPCKALVVATRKPKTQPIPRFDNNNIILLDENNAPLGTRIRGPIPAILRRQRDKFSKVIALASKFV
eukprot:gene6812-12403_t